MRERNEEWAYLLTDTLPVNDTCPTFENDGESETNSWIGDKNGFSFILSPFEGCWSEGLDFNNVAEGNGGFEGNWRGWLINTNRWKFARVWFGVWRSTFKLALIPPSRNATTSLVLITKFVKKNCSSLKFEIGLKPKGADFFPLLPFFPFRWRLEGLLPGEETTTCKWSEDKAESTIFFPCPQKILKHLTERMVRRDWHWARWPLYFFTI